MSDCPDNIREAMGRDASDQEINAVLHGMSNSAEARASAENMNFETALKQIAGEMGVSEQAMHSLVKRNALLTIATKRRAKDFARQFETPGEGARAYLEGSNKNLAGARDSVDYNHRAIHLKYAGRLISELDQAGVLKDFLSGELKREIYHEMGELTDEGTSGSSGSAKARDIAKIIEGVTDEMVSRQNRAGAYIERIPGYVVRQTHDRGAIRQAGQDGGPLDMSKSRNAWVAAVTPLIDAERTFKGEDPGIFMRRIHEGLYTGVHGPDLDEATILPTGFTTNFGNKASKTRVLHFKDADSAFQYNQLFGIRDLKYQIFSDLSMRARSIALMEKLGPNPEANYAKLVRELAEEARSSDNSAAMINSLNDWRVKAAYDTVSGKTDFPQSHTLASAMGAVKAATTLAKMGGTVITSIADKGFFQTEMAYQGISGLDTMMKQISLFASKSPEERNMLRMMGVAMDGLLGSVSSRYTLHTSVAGVSHTLQQKMFGVNFLNWWTDAHKGGAAQLMSAHLGENSHLSWSDLPPDLSHTLRLYGIGADDWDVIRPHAWTIGDDGTKYLTPDALRNIPEASIDKSLADRGFTVTTANRLRERDRLETQLRTYIADRVDIAVPTPGAAERKYLTLGTQAGTPIGEGVRLLSMFRSFPLTVLTKVVGRDVYGRGSDSIKDWLLHDNQGKFRVAQMIAMTTTLGYLSGAIKDALQGKTPQEIFTDGKPNWDVLQRAMLRGGGAGIMGDTLLADYDQSRKDFTKYLAGPVLGQLDPIADMLTKARRGDYWDEASHASLKGDAGKFATDNAPLINLFYIRPVMDYLFLWNLQEFTNPGSLGRSEQTTVNRHHQDYWMRPSENTQ